MTKKEIKYSLIMSVNMGERAGYTGSGNWVTESAAMRFSVLIQWTGRLQNSPYFCVFKYARAVKQKVWNEAENKERDWRETGM